MICIILLNQFMKELVSFGLVTFEDFDKLLENGFQV